VLTARTLAYLVDDLRDPELRTHLERNARHRRAGLEAIIRDAIESGELASSTDPRALTRLVEALVPGSMLTWATYREGDAKRWLLRDLDALLAPLRPTPSRVRKRRGPST
jgi:hypothetical protein